VLSAAEEAYPLTSSFVPAFLFPSHQDPAVAQSILSVIASSTMTVVSIVFAILLMTLTLASMQFSPRILISFVRDRGTQWTLGIFLGTFCYCVAAMPTARSLPHPFSPIATVCGAMVLAVLCVGWLLFFIQHISHAISVNHIVDRIAGETEEVIFDLMPHPRNEHAPAQVPSIAHDHYDHAISCSTSGYIRIIDTQALLHFAKTYHLRIRVTRKIGDFVPRGVPLLMLSKNPADESATRELLAAFDIGPMRSLQQDVEYGIIQIADIALRAISPAVNDPSTAISAIDQLTRIMITWLSRQPPETNLCDPPYVVRVIIPWIDFSGLLDTAIEQIRAYATGDAAVSLRLLRMLQDLAITTPNTAPNAALRAEMFIRGVGVVEGCKPHLPPADIQRLAIRLKNLEKITTPAAI